MALLMALGAAAGLDALAADAPRQHPEASTTMEQTTSLEQQRLSISLGSTRFQARLYDSPATREFLSRLPLTIAMRDIGNKEKYAAFPGGLESSTLIHHNEPGQLVYWPTGPGIAIYYKTDGKPVRGGIVVMAKIESGTEALKDAGAGEVTFSLINAREEQVRGR